ncbi:uncharacterized protein V1516DRAFT_671384 [Lipomyces oligophaga]|uniref:uncharacterized protein n=1 Tax=Lipomyces oligophaga TaxID=45792 RepID=UPI0034CDC7F4
MHSIGPARKNEGKTTADLLHDLNKLPLFMTELDTTGDDGKTSNLALEALQALAYEGTPLEVARNFKIQGNECFAGTQYKDAIEFYTKGIATATGQTATTTLEEAHDSRTEDLNRKLTAAELAELDHKAAELFLNSKEVRTDSPLKLDTTTAESSTVELEQLALTCYLNRAACNLELKNYRKVITDCTVVLKSQPDNAKAYYRIAKACLAVDRLDEAKQCVDRGLDLEPASAFFQDLSIKVFKRQDYLLKLEQQKTQRPVMKKHVVQLD